MSRVFEHRRVWVMDQAVCEAGCALLAAAAARRFAPFDAVVGVARGGCRPAETVAANLGLPVVTVRAQHNRSEAVRSRANGYVEMEEPDLGALRARPRLLVVDDVCGSGATLAAVVGLLRARLCPTGLRTAALCRNGGARTRPDVWVWDVRDWVVFPWEEPPGEAAEPLPSPSFVRFGR
jgi:hypoxanthine phosphoribosyltransferase